MCAEQQKASTNNSSDNSQRTMKQSTSKLHIIRLRGLPFSATPADIKSFLAPIELPDGINSIQMVRRPDLRPTGEAYVHLSTETDVMQALNKHKQMMGKRYIEVCRVNSMQPSLVPAESRQQRAFSTAAQRICGETVGECLLVACTPATFQTLPCLLAPARVSHLKQQCYILEHHAVQASILQFAQHCVAHVNCICADAVLMCAGVPIMPG